MLDRPTAPQRGPHSTWRHRPDFLGQRKETQGDRSSTPFSPLGWAGIAVCPLTGDTRGRRAGQDGAQCWVLRRTPGPHRRPLRVFSKGPVWTLHGCDPCPGSSPPPFPASQPRLPGHLRLSPPGLFWEGASPSEWPQQESEAFPGSLEKSSGYDLGPTVASEPSLPCWGHDCPRAPG